MYLFNSVFARFALVLICIGQNSIAHATLTGRQLHPVSFTSFQISSMPVETEPRSISSTTQQSQKLHDILVKKMELSLFISEMAQSIRKPALEVASADSFGWHQLLVNNSPKYETLIQGNGSPTFSPSFDCNKAGTPTEFAICGSEVLSMFDRNIAAAYSDARKGMDEQRKSLLTVSQREFIKKRDTCRANEACLIGAMSTRIEELDQISYRISETADDRHQQVSGTGVAQQAKMAAPAGNGNIQKRDDGIIMVDGRLGVFMNGANPEQAKRDEANASVGKAFHILGIKHFSTLEADPQFVLNTLYLLPIETIKAMAVEAAGMERPAFDRTLKDIGTRNGLAAIGRLYQQNLENDFERARFLDIAKRRIAAIAQSNQIPEPLAIKVVCMFQFEAYDFAEGYFPIDERSLRRSCTKNGFYTAGIFSSTFEVDLQGAPDKLILPPEQAEAFVGQTSRGTTLLSFDAVVESRAVMDRGQGSYAFTARRVGSYQVHTKARFSPPIYTFDEQQIQQTVALKKKSEAERLNAQEQQRLDEQERLEREAQARRQKELDAKAAEEAERAETLAARQREQDQRDAELKQAEQTAKGVQFPILETRLGEDMRRAVSRIRSELTGSQVYFATRAQRKGFSTGSGLTVEDWSPYHEGALIVNGDGKDMISVYHEPLINEGKITALSRTRLFAPGTGFGFQSFVELLQETYGALDDQQLRQLDRTDGAVFIWRPDPSAFVKATPVPGNSDLSADLPRPSISDPNTQACIRSLNARARAVGSSNMMAAQALTEGIPLNPETGWPWFDEAGSRWSPTTALPIDPDSVFAGVVACPPFETLVVWISLGTDGRVTEFRQLLANPVERHLRAEDLKTEALSEPPDAGTAGDGFKL